MRLTDAQVRIVEEALRAKLKGLFPHDDLVYAFCEELADAVADALAESDA